MAAKLFSREEVAKHSSDAFTAETKAPYIILHNKVYDVSGWLNDHPGGCEILLQHAGSDATQVFEDQYHSATARARRASFYVGDLVPEEQSLCVCRHASAEIRMVYFDYSFSEQQQKPLKDKLQDVLCEAGITAEEFLNYRTEIVSVQEEKLDLETQVEEHQYPLQVKLEPDAQNQSGGGGQSSRVLQAAVLVFLALYVRKALASPPIPAVTYSKSLRHAHLGMAVGAFVGIGSVQAALRSDGAAKRNYMLLHKSSGVLMLLAILLRIKLRLGSAIPPSFPGPKIVQTLERSGHKLAYALLLALPLSGATFGYFSGTGVPLLGKAASPSDEDLKLAQRALDVHKTLGRLLEYAWVPIHLALSAYHASSGRNIVRRISPFL